MYNAKQRDECVYCCCDEIDDDDVDDVVDDDDVDDDDNVGIGGVGGPQTEWMKEMVFLNRYTLTHTNTLKQANVREREIAKFIQSW